MHLTRKDMIKAAIPAYGFLVVSFPFVGVAHPPQASMSQSRVMKANPLPTATPVLHRTTESKREVNVLDHVIEPVLSFVLGAALTAVFFVRKRSNRFI